MITSFLPIIHDTTEINVDCGVVGCDEKAEWYGWSYINGTVIEMVIKDNVLGCHNTVEVYCLLVFCNAHREIYDNENTQIY